MRSFREKIIREMTNGGGPDILNWDLFYEVDVADLAENGYLECLDDLRPDSEDYFQAAFDSLLINGKMYSIPFDFTIRLAAYSPEVFTDNLETFSLQDMMEKVKTGNTEILSYDRFGQGTSPYWIVMNYGLYDESNKAFIDWEQKLSHLNEEPFLEFLRFLISREEQMRYVRYDTYEEMEYLGEGMSLYGYRADFPVYKDALEVLREVFQLRRLRENFMKGFNCI